MNSLAKALINEPIYLSSQQRQHSRREPCYFSSMKADMKEIDIYIRLEALMLNRRRHEPTPNVYI